MQTTAFLCLPSHSPSALVTASTTRTALVIWHATNVMILKLSQDALVRVYLLKTTATIPTESAFWHTLETTTFQLVRFLLGTARVIATSMPTVLEVSSASTDRAPSLCLDVLDSVSLELIIAPVVNHFGSMETAALPCLLSHSPSALVTATTTRTALVIWHATTVMIPKLSQDALVQVYLLKTTATTRCGTPSSHQFRCRHQN